jgi:hypothetical protein
MAENAKQNKNKYWRNKKFLICWWWECVLVQLEFPEKTKSRTAI